jgi:hypothetical protein
LCSPEVDSATGVLPDKNLGVAQVRDPEFNPKFNQSIINQLNKFPTVSEVRERL